jgi:CHAT domain
VHDLDARGIAPRRIVLAACDSAADVAYGGEELVGFVSAPLARGTAGVVAGVVAVGDAEAVELMTSERPPAVRQPVWLSWPTAQAEIGTGATVLPWTTRF